MKKWPTVDGCEIAQVAELISLDLHSSHFTVPVFDRHPPAWSASRLASFDCQSWTLGKPWRSAMEMHWKTRRNTMEKSVLGLFNNGLHTSTFFEEYIIHDQYTVVAVLQTNPFIIGNMEERWPRWMGREWVKKVHQQQSMASHGQQGVCHGMSTTMAPQKCANNGWNLRPGWKYER